MILESRLELRAHTALASLVVVAELPRRVLGPVLSCPVLSSCPLPIGGVGGHGGWWCALYGLMGCPMAYGLWAFGVVGAATPL